MDHETLEFEELDAAVAPADVRPLLQTLRRERDLLTAAILDAEDRIRRAESASASARTANVEQAQLY